MKKMEGLRLAKRLYKINKYVKKHPEIELVTDKWIADNKISTDNEHDIKDFVEWFSNNIKKV